MKVLFVFNHPAPYKVRLFNELAKFIDLQVIFERSKAKDRPVSFYEGNVYNFKTIFLERGSFSKENSNTNELKKYIAEHYQEYDLIIMNGYSTFTEMKAIHYMNKHHIKYILYINGGVLRKECRLKTHIKKKIISSAWKYVSPCEEADLYLTHYGAQKENIYHYPYSTFYDEDVLVSPLGKEEKEKIQMEWKLPSSPIFVSAGQFIERKNNLFLISLFKNRKDHLLLIGSGPLYEKYHEFIKENNMENVQIIPFMEHEQLFKVLQGCDYFVTLSKEDIYGHTTNEAMANGLPVISSDAVVSSRHLIKNGYNGFLVSLNDKEQIIQALNSVNSKMSYGALETARENTIGKTGKAHIAIFEEIKKCA